MRERLELSEAYRAQMIELSRCLIEEKMTSMLATHSYWVVKMS